MNVVIVVCMYWNFLLQCFTFTQLQKFKMTATQDVIYQEAMTKGKDYQIYLQKYYDTIFDYVILFNENTGELKLKWHAYMMRSQAKERTCQDKRIRTNLYFSWCTWFSRRGMHWVHSASFSEWNTASFSEWKLTRKQKEVMLDVFCKGNSIGEDIHSLSMQFLMNKINVYMTGRNEQLPICKLSVTEFIDG